MTPVEKFKDLIKRYGNVFSEQLVDMPNTSSFYVDKTSRLNPCYDKAVNEAYDKLDGFDPMQMVKDDFAAGMAAIEISWKYNISQTTPGEWRKQKFQTKMRAGIVWEFYKKFSAAKSSSV